MINAIILLGTNDKSIMVKNLVEIIHSYNFRYLLYASNNNNTSQYDPAYAGSGEIRM